MAVCITFMLPNKNGGGRKGGAGHARQISGNDTNMNVSVGYLGRDDNARYNFLKLLNDQTMYWANLYGLTVSPLDTSSPTNLSSKRTLCFKFSEMKKCLDIFSKQKETNEIEMSARLSLLHQMAHICHHQHRTHTLRDNFLK